jgi:hypothetical protein
VTGNILDMDGQKIPITPEHAPQIIGAVRELRSRLGREQSKTQVPFATNRLDLN